MTPAPFSSRIQLDTGRGESRGELPAAAAGSGAPLRERCRELGINSLAVAQGES